tara:strand:- start:419 stop:715 length:297 start_codon:yes stop_codon:yes gene_type:complete
MIPPDAEFVNPFTHGFHIARVAQRKSADAGEDASLPLTVLESTKPVLESGSGEDRLNAANVNHGIHIRQWPGLPAQALVTGECIHGKQGDKPGSVSPG